MYHGRSLTLRTGKHVRGPRRKKRRCHMGGYPAETKIGERRIKKVRVRGGNQKIKVLSDMYTNLVDKSSGKTIKTKIIDVISNPSNVKYTRSKIITKGAIILTEAGKAVVTSRPGKDGVINSVLLEENE